MKNVFATYRFLLILRVKKLIRTTLNFEKINLALSALVVLFCSYSIILAGKVFKVQFGSQLVGQTNFQVFRKIILFYFLFETLLRFFLQKMPGINIKYYKTLNISKKILADYILIDSILNISNLLTVLFFSCFLFPEIFENYSFFDCIIFTISFFSIVFVINIIITVTKTLSYFYSTISVFFPGFLITLIVFLLTLEGEAKVNMGFAGFIFSLPGCFFVSVLGLLFSQFALWFISKIFYKELLQKSVIRANHLFLGSPRQVISAWIALELKLIFRNSRTKKIIAGSLLYQVSAIYFLYYNGRSDYYSLIIFTLAGLSMLALSYGQFYFSWHSEHICLLFLIPISLNKFLKAKLILLSTMCFVFYFPLLFAFWGNEILLLEFFCCLIYSMGFIPLSCLLSGLFNYKPINISAKGLLANWEGIGVVQVITGAPFFLVPLLLISLFNYWGIPKMTFLVLALIGFVVLISNNLWIAYIANAFKARKYRMIGSFTK